jgi:hypothetical protein
VKTSQKSKSLEYLTLGQKILHFCQAFLFNIMILDYLDQFLPWIRERKVAEFPREGLYAP